MDQNVFVRFFSLTCRTDTTDKSSQYIIALDAATVHRIDRYFSSACSYWTKGQAQLIHLFDAERDYKPTGTFRQSHPVQTSLTVDRLEVMTELDTGFRHLGL